MIWMPGLFILTPGIVQIGMPSIRGLRLVSKNIEPHRTQRIRWSRSRNSPESSPADRMEVTFEIPDFCLKILNRLDNGSHPKQSSGAC